MACYDPIALVYCASQRPSEGAVVLLSEFRPTDTRGTLLNVMSPILVFPEHA